MPENGQSRPPSQGLVAEETKQYFESHPELVEQLRRAEKVYKIFGDFLNLTQTRIIVRESGGSIAEADLSASLLRTDREVAKHSGAI